MKRRSNKPKVVHGLSIPLGQFGFYLPRTLSRSLASPGSGEEPNTASRIRGRVATLGSLLPPFRNQSNSVNPTEPSSPIVSRPTSVPPVSRAGGSTAAETDAKKRGSEADRAAGVLVSGPSTSSSSGAPDSRSPAAVPNRVIRFPDEERPSAGETAGERPGVAQENTNNATAGVARD